VPIERSICIQNVSKEVFDVRDKIVMRCAYDAQNALGRLCDEKVYETDLTRRLRAAGFREVHTQVPVRVVHGDFQKEYRCDLVADDVLYELKTVRALVAEHDAQVLNYAMLLSINHGKLINFRNARVEGKLLFNAIDEATRYRFTCDSSLYRPLSAQCEELQEFTTSLLEDWGAFLDFNLYQEALVHHFSSAGHGHCRAALTFEGIKLGMQDFSFHHPEVCFVVSGYQEPGGMTSHYLRLLALSEFKGMQWINMHHDTIGFKTLVR
jgi:GxxExxY protein